MITLLLRPHVERDGCHRDRFGAFHEGRLLVVSRQPLLAGARALLELGHDPDAPLTARHDGQRSAAFVPKPIGELAGWTIAEENRDGLRWRRWRNPDMASPTAEDGAAGIRAA